MCDICDHINYNFELFLEIMGAVSSRLKKRRTIWIVINVKYRLSTVKPASLMVWGCISDNGTGKLHIWRGTINAERYVEVLEHHMPPLNFFRERHVYFRETLLIFILHLL